MDDFVGLVIPHIGNVLVFALHEAEQMIPTLGVLIGFPRKVALKPFKFLGFLLGYIELRPVGHGNRVLYAHVDSAGFSLFWKIRDFGSQAKLDMEAIRLPYQKTVMKII